MCDYSSCRYRKRRAEEPSDQPQRASGSLIDQLITQPGTAAAWPHLQAGKARWHTGGRRGSELGRRPEAIAAYNKAAAMPLAMRHDQYGIALTKEYAQQRAKTPFTRVENRHED